MAETLEDVARELKAAAEGIGALVLEALPMRDMPLVTLDAASFRRLVEHVRPRIVYLVEAAFDQDAEFQEELDADTPLPPELDALRWRYRVRQGACCQITGGVVVEGVLHVLMVATGWYDEFESEVEQAREQIAAAAALEEAAADATAEAGFREYARKLAAEPAFTQGRPSIEKRRALAQHLFRELDELAASRVTAMADLIGWLQSHGFQPNEGS